MTGTPSFLRYCSMSKQAVRNIGVVAVRVENALDEVGHAQSSFLSTWPRSKILALYYPPPEMNNIHFKY